MLTVVMTSIPCREQVDHVLPSLARAAAPGMFVCASSSTSATSGSRSDHGVGVHLLEHRVRGTRPCARDRSRGPRASRSCWGGRRSRRTRRRPGSRARLGDGPRTASRRSCRPRARRRGRSAAAPTSPRAPRSGPTAAAPSAPQRPRARSAPRPTRLPARGPPARAVSSPWPKRTPAPCASDGELEARVHHQDPAVLLAEHAFHDHPRTEREPADRPATHEPDRRPRRCRRRRPPRATRCPPSGTP